MRKIYFYHLAPRMHSSTKLLIENPPEGYEFILPENLSENKIKTNILRFALDSKFIKFLYKKIIRNIFNPLKLYGNVYSTNIPKNIDLVYSCRPIKVDKPHIIEILDHPACLAGYDYNFFTKNKKNIENSLLSRFCRKIIVVNESSMQIMKKNFNKEVIKKTTLIRAAVKKQKFRKNYNKKILHIIFIGSVANPEDFYIKGGLEAIESFKRISEKFDNIKMILRCKVPKEIKEKYKDVKNLKIIEEHLIQDMWSKMLKNADICLNPGHVCPFMATLESMSYGMPIIMLDTYWVRDFLTNGKNAILIKPSSKIRGYKSKEYPLNIRSKSFINEIKNLDEKVIERICKALIKLIENPKLREKLGRNGKKIAETKFSIETRNKKLKKVFDKALKIQ